MQSDSLWIRHSRTCEIWHDADKQKPLINQFERLKEKAKANNFNAQLISMMMIATVLAAFCAINLAQECTISRRFARGTTSISGR
jgi:hypothetical protein